MKVLEGVQVVQRFFPKAKLVVPQDEHKRDVLHNRLHALACEKIETYQDFIRQMDAHGLSVDDNRIVLF